jgi:hypothetical protein
MGLEKSKEAAELKIKAQDVSEDQGNRIFNVIKRSIDL